MLRKTKKKGRGRLHSTLVFLSAIAFIIILSYGILSLLTTKKNTVPVASALLNYGFGMSLGTTLLSLTPAQLNAELNDLVALHIGWIRIDFDWSVIQPTNSTSYNWTQYDQVIAAANARGIKVLGLIGYTPKWARGLGCTSEACPPANDDAFASFASAVVTRYASKGLHDWEIWNEPNNAAFWKPSANVAAYAELLEAAYPAIKAVDSSAFVITGGLAPETTSGGNIAPLDYLSQLYALGAQGYFDAVGFHPYSYPALPSHFAISNTWSQMGSTTPSARSIMMDNGDSDKQVWITEFGAPTGGPTGSYVSELTQSEMISQAITLKESYPWAGPLFIYSYQDLGTDTNTTENFFGIINYEGTMKPSYTAIKQFLSPHS
jgi:hypothetical protein